MEKTMQQQPQIKKQRKIKKFWLEVIQAMFGCAAFAGTVCLIFFLALL